ncbi:MAG: hypothetical protein GY726_10175 [Proteobacteria bacterium]|nr:hypothetical protein [Pseudomonadota bacterium]
MSFGPLTAWRRLAPASPTGTGPAPWTHVLKLNAPGFILAAQGHNGFAIDMVITYVTIPGACG